MSGRFTSVFEKQQQFDYREFIRKPVSEDLIGKWKHVFKKKLFRYTISNQTE
jgi:hypothetical protein